MLQKDIVSYHIADTGGNTDVIAALSNHKIVIMQMPYINT